MNKIPYGKQLIDDNDKDMVIEALLGNRITQGPFVEKFEQAIAKYCGVKYAVAVSSGTAALHLAYLAGGIGPGDEVITTPITFVATSNAVIYTGAKPVFADIDSDTLNISPEDILKKLTKKTKALIPVHFAGLPAEMAEISRIAKNNSLFIIEDACHALGSEYKGQKIGSCKFSNMTVFSFHPVKAITTAEGGMITTNSLKLYKKLLALRTHGIYKDEKTFRKGGWYYEMRDLGFNYRLSDIQSALGVSQLKKIDSFIKRRSKIARMYDDAFKEVEPIIKIPPKVDRDVRHGWHLYVLRVNHKRIYRKRFFDALHDKNIAVQIHYIPVYKQPYYKRYAIWKGNFPVSENYYKECVSIPIYPLMKDKDVLRVIEAVKEVVSELS